MFRKLSLFLVSCLVLALFSSASEAQSATVTAAGGVDDLSRGPTPASTGSHAPPASAGSLPPLPVTAGGPIISTPGQLDTSLGGSATAGTSQAGGAGPLGPGGCLRVDQTSLSTNTCMAFFSQSDLAQSFTTTADTICGARIDLDPGTGPADVTVSLWDRLPNDGGIQLASGTAFAVPDGGSAIVDFGGDIPVEPGDQYFLVFTATNGNPCILGDTNDPYPGGHVYANSGFQPFPDYDYTFEVYGTPAPLCGPIDQSQLSRNTCMAFFSQPDLAQSFRTTATSLCGARVDLNPGSGGADITIELWDALPNQGGILLASGTDFNVPDGGSARVDFGSVAVTPGEELFLVFTAQNGNPCLAGDTNNPYPGGAVHANSGYDEFPEFDYTFETYGPQVTPCGAPDQTQAIEDICMATLNQNDLAQSFTTDATSLCGASIELRDNVGDSGADIQIQLWDDLPNNGGNLIALGLAADVPLGGTAYADFGVDVPVTPGEEYFLVFLAVNGSACIAGSTENPYPGGHVYANAGFNPFPGFDYAFRTFGSGGPACGPPIQSALSQNTCMAFFSQGDLAQSFTAAGSAVCGARLDLRENTGGNVNVTIGLWDALPDEGGVMLGSGTDFGVADGGSAIVDFGSSIPVTPGVQYFLVFTATNGNACIAGDTDNPFPGGQVYANSGYSPFPNFDYTFEVYGAAAGTGQGFIRGDVNEDGTIDLSDPIAVLSLLFPPGVAVGCDDAADVNDDGAQDISDAIYLLGFLFTPGSPAPPSPHPGCGADVTVDGLNCAGHAACP